ncbi:MAG TPA: helix-turn-helix transcriptional regulator [Solirubrobacterales bacterium]
MRIAERFGRNLTACRVRVGLTQEELAFRASLHRTQVGSLERGDHMPRIDTMMKLAGALGATPNDLLKGITWTPGQTTRGQFIETQVPGLGTVHRRFQVERKG